MNHFISLIYLSASQPVSRGTYTHFFFISNSIFQLSLELLPKVPKMSLKVAMKLLTMFADFRLKYKENGQKTPKIQKVAIFYRFEAQKLLRFLKI